MIPNDERAQIRAEAVRECIAALPFPGSNVLYRGALEALLRKPDPATALINDWLSTVSIEPERAAAAMLLTFARWAVDTGRVKG